MEATPGASEGVASRIMGPSPLGRPLNLRPAPPSINCAPKWTAPGAVRADTPRVDDGKDVPTTLARLPIFLLDAQATSSHPARGALLEIAWAPFAADEASGVSRDR